ncbi:hypothetical protein [Desulfotomaculum sp. 1211_IL3151]|uniref:hypothetical protein n=1 Tax=Desulfotomaculum sp. 1211_IL3151 TaxID=3084055 RepID=UPI002FDACFF5
MNRVAALNASPKTTKSVSGMLIEKMEGILNLKIDAYQATQLIRQEKISESIAEIFTADALLIVFPLYVDSLPAPLIKLLTIMEETAKAANLSLPVVYAICNCGFYEAEHTRPALHMLRHFALRAGLTWGYGIGIGGGGFVQSTSKNMAKGPGANIYAALCTLGEVIRNNSAEEREDVFVMPKIPRFLYKIGGNIGWRQMAKQNGVGRKLHARPHS